VLWNSRPAKNGQPPPCYGQCNINVGTRKVGAALKRLPDLHYGMKAKEQILQRWDPVSRSLVNIHFRAPPPPFSGISNVILQISNPVYDNDMDQYASNYTVSFDTTLETEEPIQYSVFYVGTPDISIFDEIVYSISKTGAIQYTTSYDDKTFYAVLTYQGITFTSPNVYVPAMLQIANFVGTQSLILPFSYSYVVTFISPLDHSYMGTYILYSNTENSYQGPNVQSLGAPIGIYADVSQTDPIEADITSLLYVFGQISLGGVTVNTPIIQIILPNIEFTDFYITPVSETEGDIGISLSYVGFNTVYTGGLATIYDHGTSGFFESEPTVVGTQAFTTADTSVVISNQTLASGHYYYATIVVASISRNAPALVYFDAPIPL
jgi:hypothetical protein